MSPQWSPTLRFPHQDLIHPLSSPIRATCPAHLILLDFIPYAILGEGYKSFSSSLCNVTTEVYLEIMNEFVNQLTDDELTGGYYQQDGATCNTSNASMRVIQSFFSRKNYLIKKIWPPRSPDLTPIDFFL